MSSGYRGNAAEEKAQKGEKNCAQKNGAGIERQQRGTEGCIDKEGGHLWKTGSMLEHLWQTGRTQRKAEYSDPSHRGVLITG